MYASQLQEALGVLAKTGLDVDPVTITSAVHINSNGHRRTTICHRDAFGRTMTRKMVWWKPDGTSEVHTV
jgi:hypothetical protein